MNSTSLHALIVDQQLGELSPEVAELLELHLARDSAARGEAERIKQSLAATEGAVVRHAELARIELVEPQRRWHFGFGQSWLAQAASIALLAAVASTAGFFLGKKQESSSLPPAAPLLAEVEQRPPRKDSPWARYRFRPERSATGMQIVRVDPTRLNDSNLR